MLLLSLDIHEISFLHFGPHSIITSYLRALFFWPHLSQTSNSEIWESIFCARANILLLLSLDIHEISFLCFGPHSIITSYLRALCRKLCYDFKDATKKLNLACWFSLLVNLIWWHMKSNLGSFHTSLSLFFNSWHVLFSCLTIWSVSLHGRVWSTGKKKKLQIHWLCSISIIYSSNVRFISIFTLNHQFAFPYHFLHP